MALKKYKDGEVVYEADKSGGTLAPVLADMTLGKARGLYGEYVGAEQFIGDMNDGSGDTIDHLDKANRSATFLAGKLEQGGQLAQKLNLGDKAAKKFGTLAGETVSKASKAAEKAGSVTFDALDKSPIGDVLTVAQSVRNLTSGSMSHATDDERAATAASGTAAALSATAAVTGAKGSLAAAGAAAAGKAAAGAGLSSTVSAGLTALGPIGWATLAVGATAAALGAFGNKTFRKRGKW